MRAGVPIVPIAVVGDEEAMPIVWKSARLAKAARPPVLPRHREPARVRPGSALVPSCPAKFRIRVLPPVHFDVAPEPGALLAGRVMDESERIRALIQDALYDMLRTRRSVWFG